MCFSQTQPLRVIQSGQFHLFWVEIGLHIFPDAPLHELSVEAFFLQDKKSFSHHVPLFGPFDCVVGHCSLFPAARNQNFSIGRMAQSKRGCCAKPCTAAPFQVQIIIRRYDCLFRLPFRLIVATAWLAYSNVDLFIRGHKMRLHPYRVEPLQSYYSI